MKKILAILLAGIILLCAVACESKKEEENKGKEDETEALAQNSIEEEKNNGKFLFDTNDNGDYEIIGYESYVSTPVDIVLPKKVNERNIVGIAENTFKAIYTIKSVTIPATYTYIGDYAFYDCDSLEAITLPSPSENDGTSGIEEIGVGAFESCGALKSVTLSTAIEVIPEYAFKDCSALTGIDASSVKSIKKGAFLNCSALETVTVSETLEYATKEAFYGCDKLTYTEYDNALYLGNESNPTLLLVSAKTLNETECAVSSTTKVVADAAFSNCKYLETVTLSSSVKGINGTSFSGCGELNYNESENGFYLGTEANPYLALIELDIKSVEDFKLNESTKIITDTAFAKCPSIKDISFDGTAAAWKSIIKSENWNNDLTVSIICSDDTVTVLG